MANKAIKLLSFVCVAIFAMLLIFPTGHAYTITGYYTSATEISSGLKYCTCENCSDCNSALNDVSCKIVKLNQSITNQTGTCINNPANFTNKTFDCQGHTIDADSSGSARKQIYGIYLNNKKNNTIKNCVITDFGLGGVYLNFSSNNTLINNTLISNGRGISLESSSNNNLINNNASSNYYGGISIENSSYNIITNNIANSNACCWTMGGPSDGIGIILDSSSNNNQLSDNNICNNVGMDIYNEGHGNTGSWNRCNTTNNFTCVFTNCDKTCYGEGEGGAIIPNELGCCDGLNKVGNVDSSCRPMIGGFTCINCGNGVCGAGENKCNCPEDCLVCPNVTLTTAKTQYQKGERISITANSASGNFSVMMYGAPFSIQKYEAGVWVNVGTYASDPCDCQNVAQCIGTTSCGAKEMCTNNFFNSYCYVPCTTNADCDGSQEAVCSYPGPPGPIFAPPPTCKSTSSKAFSWNQKQSAQESRSCGTETYTATTLAQADCGKYKFVFNYYCDNSSQCYNTPKQTKEKEFEIIGCSGGNNNGGNNGSNNGGRSSGGGGSYTQSIEYKIPSQLCSDRNICIETLNADRVFVHLDGTQIGITSNNLFCFKTTKGNHSIRLAKGGFTSRTIDLSVGVCASCTCRDGVCNSTCGETEISCPYDCKTSTPNITQLYCGDKICNNNENCTSCSQDCGTCSKPICELFGLGFGNFIVCWYWWLLLLLMVGGYFGYRKYKQNKEK